MERLITGVITALALSLTAICFALFLSLYRGGIGVNESIALWSVFPKFLAILSAVGFVLGAVLNAERSVNLLANMWATDEPRRPLLTVLIWSALFVIWFVAYKVALNVQP